MTMGTDVRPGVYENWHQWHRVEHGEGSLVNLRRELARLRIERPFLVTTRSLVASDLLAHVKASCGVPVVGKFSEAQAHAATTLAASCGVQTAAMDVSDETSVTRGFTQSDAGHHGVDVLGCGVRHHRDRCERRFVHALSAPLL